MKSKIEFPDIFRTGELPTNWSNESLVADGLSGWACCSLGIEMPEKFGEGMALIASKVGTAIPDKLNDLADKFLAELRQKSQPIN